MRKKRRTAGRPEMLRRNVVVSSVSMRVSQHAVHQRGCEPEIEGQPWLEIRGTLDEPVGGVPDIEFSLYPKEKVEVGSARPASVGAIIQVKPHVRAVVPFARSDFDGLWSFALSGQLKHAYLAFTKPRYGSGLVVNVSFSSEPEE